MKEKLMMFFSGKALYVSIASILVCVVAVTGSIIAVKSNNNKLEKAFESLSNVITEGTTEPSLEAVQSEIETIVTQNSQQVKTDYGDKGILYLKEYDKLTETYKAKKAELEGKIRSDFPEYPSLEMHDSGELRPLTRGTDIFGQPESDEKFSKRAEEYEILVSKHDVASLANAVLVSEYEQKKAPIEQHNQNIKIQITDLDLKYTKDVNNLKIKYSIK